MSDPGDIGGGGPTNTLAQKLAIAEAQKEYLEAVGQTNEALVNQIKLEEDLNAQYEAREKALEAYERAAASGDETAKRAAMDALSGQDELLQKQVALNDSYKQGTQAASTFAAAVAGIGQGPQTGLGRLTSNMMKLGSLTDAAKASAKGFTDGLKTTFSRFNLVVGAADKLQEGLMAVALNMKRAALEQDGLIVGFNKATGQAGQFNGDLQNLSVSLLSVGVSQREAVAGFQALFTTVRDFADFTPEVRMEVAQTTALLSKMGFDANAQAQNILFLTKSMGTSATEAAQFNTRLASLANELDMPIGDLVQGFEQAKSVLGASAQGSAELTEQFGMLAAQADATNLSIGKLINIAKKFDTFEGAAQQVGVLNSVLGGPFLSTIQMIETTNPAERLEMIASAVQNAGLSFDEMGYYQRQVIANAAGLEDVNDLALLLSGNLEGLAPPEMDTQSIIEMKNQMAAFNTVMESLNTILQATVISFGPLIELLKFGALGISGVVSAVLSPLAVVNDALRPLVEGDDVLSGPVGASGRGGRVLLGPEGAISLNNRDTVVAGTNLTRMSVAGSGGSSAAPAAAGASGPISMNVVLSIDGQEIRTVVNSVKIDPALNPNLHNSIAKLITRGDDIL